MGVTGMGEYSMGVSHWYGRIQHGNEFTTRMSHSRIDKGSPGGAHHSGTSIHNYGNCNGMSYIL